MNRFEVEQFMTMNAKFFEKSEIQRFKNEMYSSNMSLFVANTFKFKSPTTAVVLSIFLGWLGVDRFYSGNYIQGIVKLITMGMWGIWWILDWFLIGKAVKTKNQTNFYLFLKNQNPSVSFDKNRAKNIIGSKQFRDSFSDLVKSHKKTMDTMCTRD